jgi:hypothetical protein
MTVSLPMTIRVLLKSARQQASVLLSEGHVAGLAPSLSP